MKILHVCLSCFYIDNHSYQENMLPKYHKKLGYEVEIIASHEDFDIDGNKTNTGKYREYYNEDEIKVTRLNYSKYPFSKIFKLYSQTYKSLEKSKPDIIFVHGSQFLDLNKIIKYCKKNPEVKLFIDNHADFSNSATNWISKEILHKVIWKKNIKKSISYTEKFYGVLPARVDFLSDVYKVPKNKIDLLVMGVDDEEVLNAKKRKIEMKLRKKYNIQDKDFLIITGGKIDKAKVQTIDLIKIVKKINQKNIKLIIFGSIVEDLKEEINKLVDNESIIYVGWITSKETYDYFSISNLAIFPGRHSVLWEQVVGMGLPCIFKYWKGTTHIDKCSNVDFIYDDKDVNFLEEKILKYANDEKYYSIMKDKATIASKSFSYYEIAKQSIAK